MLKPSRLRILLPLALVLAASAADPITAQSDRIREILRQTPLIDGHNDAPEQYLDRAANHLARIDFMDTSALSPPNDARLDEADHPAAPPARKE